MTDAHHHAADVASADALDTSFDSATTRPPAVEVATIGDAQRLISAIGSLHVPLIEFRSATDSPEWLAIIGEPTLATGAWIVSNDATTGPSLHVVFEWPAGVRVLRAVARDSDVWLLVESIRARDQPAGARGVVIIPTRPPVPNAVLIARMGPTAAAITTMSPDDFGSLVSLLQSPGACTSSSEACAALRGRAHPRLDAAGLGVYSLHQSFLMRPLATVSERDLARSPLGPAIEARLREGARSRYCDVGDCWDARVVRMTGSENAPILVSVFLEPPAAPARATTLPVAVANIDIRPSTRDAARQRRGPDARVVAEGPIVTDDPSAATGTLAVIREPDGEYDVAISDDGVVSYAPIELGARDLVGEFGFADVNGDGLTDIVARWNFRGHGTGASVYLAPSRSMEHFEFRLDPGSYFAVQNRSTIADAVRAALRVPIRRGDARLACAAFHAARTLRGLRTFGPGADALAVPIDWTHVNPPDMIALSALPESARSQRDAWIRPHSWIGESGPREHRIGCGEIECPPSRPYCEWYDTGEEGGGYREVYWFDWSTGPARLSAFGHVEF